MILCYCNCRYSNIRYSNRDCINNKSPRIKQIIPKSVFSFIIGKYTQNLNSC